MAGNSLEPGRSVTSKVTALLVAFTCGPAFSLTELARLTCLPVSTTHRLISGLVAAGMLTRTPDGQFRLGPVIRELAETPAKAPSSFHERARRVMEDLAAATGGPRIRLGVLEDDRVAYMEKASPTSPVSVAFEPDNVPAHATAMGKVLLAFGPKGLVDVVIARGLGRWAASTITRADQLQQALSTVRSTGLAVSRGEFEPETMAIAAPVIGAGGFVVAALELAQEKGRSMRELVPALVVASRWLSRELQAGRYRGQVLMNPKRHLELMILDEHPVRGLRSTPDPTPPPPYAISA
jgi:DNA-binding IclR family transcriptional regulator